MNTGAREIGENVPASIFISYAREDLDYLQKLLRHLHRLERKHNVTIWYDAHLQAGEKFHSVLDHHIRYAKIFIALISIDYLNSTYCYDIELALARSLEEQGRTRIVPVLVRACSWEDTPLAEYNVLPRNGVYLAESIDPETHLYSIARDLEELLALSNSSVDGDSNANFVSATEINIPQLPTRYVPHTQQIDRILETMLGLANRNRADPDRRPTGLAICGMAGAGKTCTAIAISRSKDVSQTFDGGIIWLHCGRDTAPLKLQEMLIRGLRSTCGCRKLRFRHATC